MKKNITKIALILILILNMFPAAAHAAYIPPTSFGAPEGFAVQYREDGIEKTWAGFEATASASTELRSFVDIVGADESPFGAAGYNLNDIYLQFDYKEGSGSWHYQNQWDQSLDYMANMSSIRYQKGVYSNYTVFDKSMFEGISGGGVLPGDKAYFDTNTMDLRVRFVVSYQDNMGTYYRYASPWSKTVTFSNNQKAEDPGALINHAPVLKSAEVRKFDEIPYLRIVSETPHEDLKTLNSISGNSVTTEVWVKSETGDWELIHSNNFVEQFDANVLAYFGLKDSYDAAIYDVKMRYAFDYHSYPAAGKSGVIYSPFSNVISHGTPEYKTSRLSGASRIETAIAVSREGWPNGAGTVILTRDDNYPDALAGAPLSKKLDAPILFTNSQTLTAATKDEIIRLKAQKVIILGGTGAVSQGVENQLKQSYEVIRIGGMDRYETAAKIAKELGYKGKVVITTGEDFHDALVVSPLAAYKGIPILMTLPNSLPAATQSALDFIAPTEITIVGDTSSVSEKVASGLANAKRVSGSNYYWTAVSVARSFGADPGKVFLATGKDFPDALSGSGLAAKYNSPILFVNDPLADEVKQYLMENKDKTAKVHLLGGEGAISTEIKNAINQIYK